MMFLLASSLVSFISYRYFVKQFQHRLLKQSDIIGIRLFIYLGLCITELLYV